MNLTELNKIELGFDVIIVGAGAAGCVLANKLSNKFKVLLVDSKPFPRKKACSGILVSEGREFFKETLSESVFSLPKEIDLEYIDINNNKRKFSKKGFFNTDRFELDKFLFEQLKTKQNITFLQETKVLEFAYAEDKKHKVVVCESKGHIKPIITKYLVGCDGALSFVRKKIFKRDIPFYVGIQELIKLDKKIDTAWFIFDNEITDFYSWVIPKGNFVEIGTLLDPYQSKEKYKLFKEKLADSFGVVGSGDIDSAIVLRPRSLKDIFLGVDNILLCGEAAGLISPSSAEGISYAVKSAELCANAINLNQNEASISYIKSCKILTNRLDKKFKKSKVLSDINKRKKLFI